MNHIGEQQGRPDLRGNVPSPVQPRPDVSAQLPIPIQSFAKKKHTYVWQCVSKRMTRNIGMGVIDEEIVYLRMRFNPLPFDELSQLRLRTMWELSHHESSDEMRIRKTSFTLFHSKHDVTYPTYGDLSTFCTSQQGERASHNRQMLPKALSEPLISWTGFPMFCFLTKSSPTCFLYHPNHIFGISIPNYFVPTTVIIFYYRLQAILISASRLQPVFIRFSRILVHMYDLNCIFTGGGVWDLRNWTSVRLPS